MKKSYIIPTLFVETIDQETILAGSPPNVNVPGGPGNGGNTEDKDIGWADSKVGYHGFLIDEDDDFIGGGN